MFHVDIPKVKGKMAERGFTITSLAKVLKISRNTLSSYLDDPSKMPYEFVSKMADLLCDNAEEATSIFCGKLTWRVSLPPGKTVYAWNIGGSP